MFDWCAVIQQRRVPTNGLRGIASVNPGHKHMQAPWPVPPPLRHAAHSRSSPPRHPQPRRAMTAPPLTPHPSPLTPHSSPLTPHSSPPTPHSSLLTPHPSLLTPHPSPLLTPHSSLLTPHPSPLLLTPHSSLLTPHPSLLTPHPSLLTQMPALPRLCQFPLALAFAGTGFLRGAGVGVATRATYAGLKQR